MSGIYTIAAAAVVSAGTGIANSMAAGKQTKFADSIASTQFNEQQGFYQQLMNLLNDPSSFATNPAFKFATETGSRQVAANMSSSGYAGSGNEAIALQNFGQQSAFTGLLGQEQLLASLTGLGASSSNAQNVQAATGASSNAFGQFMSMLPILGATTGGVGKLFGSGGTGSGAPSSGFWNYGGAGTPTTNPGGGDLNDPTYTGIN